MITVVRLRIAGFVAAIVALLGPVPAWLALGQAWAQEYEPVTAAAQTRTDPNPYLLAAYGFIWAAVLVYVIAVARGLGSARAEVAELRRRVDAATGARS
jgi:CcmD family protein